MKIHVLILLFLNLYLGACGTQKIVPKPKIVKIPGPVEYIAVPADLLILHEKTTIPEGGITYGEAIQLWEADRAIIDIQNGQLLGIDALDEEGDIE